ncbi:MAG TPA: LysM peptidoglycan-binding domain-containing protein, partial [Bacteroidales bacterium]|nr:LysM peptidoglycan-binding domain-containing protein [Bacteroidales bacterium]
MFKHCILLFLFILPSLALRAQPVEVVRSKELLTLQGISYFQHKVEKGQTLYSISRAYGASMEAIVEANPGSDAGLKLGQVLLIPAGRAQAAPAEASAAAAEGRIYHLVRQGETLYGIARIYNTSAEVLQGLNPGLSQGLHPGDRLLVPGAAAEASPSISAEGPRQYSLYTVRKAETVYGIAERLGVTVDDLYLLNPSLSQGLEEGMQIRVPVLPAQTAMPPQGPVKHKVRKGEDLASIAAQYGISVETLLAANPGLEQGLSGPARGSELVIPSAKDAAPAELSMQESPRTMAEAFQPQPVPSGKAPCTPDAHNLLPTYRVALLLPFYAAAGDTISTDPVHAVNPSEYPSFRFIQFYEGLLMALDTLEKEGLRMDLKVMDVTEDTLGLEQSLRREGLENMDLIIGPLYSGSFQVVSRFAAHYGIPLVNPFTNRDEVVLGRPHVFKAYPSEDDRMGGLADFLLDTYPGAPVFLAGKETDREKHLRRAFNRGIRQSLQAHGLDSTAWTDLSGAGVNPAGWSGKLSSVRPNVFVTLSSDQ